MAYYKDPKGGTHWLDDAAYIYLLPQGSVEITEAELPPPVVPNARDIILQKIVILEATVTDRRIREATLGVDNGWLNTLNDQIAALRSQL